MMTTILLLASSPMDQTPLGLDEEVRAIQERLRMARYGHQFRVEQEWAVRISDLQGHLLRHEPDIVHFSGHGSQNQEIALQDESGSSDLVPTGALARLFSILKGNIRCLVLNACYSAVQAEAVSQYVDCVVGMSRKISDDAAISFAASFYQALAYGRSVEEAFELGCGQIELNRLTGHEIPRLHIRAGVRADAIRFTPEVDPSLHLSGPFASLIRDKTEGFVGREYVFEAIDRFLASQPNGYFLIEGDPGVGKSAILAEYVRRTGCVSHFNVRSQGINTASQFIESVGRQLISRYHLPVRTLPPHASQSGAFLAQLLTEISAQSPDGRPLVIAVDALDEVDSASQTAGANILFLPPSLPLGVYFLLTRRRREVPFFVLAPQEEFDLGRHQTESLRDVQTYIRNATARPRLREWIERAVASADEFVAILAEKSENNFMYLRYLLPDLERGLYRDLSIENLPSGLAGYYEDHWRLMGMKDDARVRIVYILAEVLQPVSRRLISLFAAEDELTVQKVVDEWEQFLHHERVDAETRYSVYHSSFREFLHRKDIVQAAGVTIEGINALIADSFVRRLFADEGPSRKKVPPE
jgi:hypothetical protein